MARPGGDGRQGAALPCVCGMVWAARKPIGPLIQAQSHNMRWRLTDWADKIITLQWPPPAQPHGRVPRLSAHSLPVLLGPEIEHDGKLVHRQANLTPCGSDIRIRFRRIEEHHRHHGLTPGALERPVSRSVRWGSARFQASVAQPAVIAAGPS
jgi:hypothetical protein